MAGVGVRMRREPPTLPADVVDALRRYRWPGNIRELKNVMERASIMAGGTAITPEMLALDPSRVVSSPSTRSLKASSAGTSLSEPASPARRRRGPRVDDSRARRAAVQAALDRHHGNIKAAAEELGMSRASLYRRIERWRLNRR